MKEEPIRERCTEESPRLNCGCCGDVTLECNREKHHNGWHTFTETIRGTTLAYQWKTDEQ